MKRGEALQKLRAAVKEHGSQRAAAEAWGVQVTYLNEILSGKRQPVALPNHLLSKVGLQAVVRTTVRYSEVSA